ncbi:MAG: carboxymethylenebutenolidase [Alphaproteobacteria bacterium]|nr:carboxymethylenebutenolidase [Alphaproteobacteria bacterium]
MDDIRSLYPKTHVSRRGFVAATAVGAGFALAVQPISAQTVITTDAGGLMAGDASIPTPNGAIYGYYAMPGTGGPFPVVVVIQEVFGVHEHIKDVARRFAKAGYLAVAPDLHGRQGDTTKAPDIQAILAIVNKAPDAQVYADLDSAVAWAKASGKGDTQRLGVTGFCWGGRMTWMYTAHNPAVKAAAPWYGPITRPATELQPKHPLDVVDQIKIPVLGLYGGADGGIPNDTVEKMQAALKAKGNASEIIIYPDTPHGFHADYRPTYRADKAKDGWTRLMAYFKSRGVA